MESQTLVLLNPEQIVADDNARFGLRNIPELMQSIVDAGEVLTPVEVEEIEGGYRLTAGFRRHAAVTEANKQGAGLLLPAIVRNTGSELERLKHQLSENVQRENLSPMDTAVAIQKMLDLGVSRADVRKTFTRPTAKKGIRQPASNAWVNIMLNLLDLPKTVQADIHEGIIGVEAAYVLGKVPTDKREGVVKRAKADFTARIEEEAKDEEKFLKVEARAKESEDAAQAAQDDIARLSAEVQQASALVNTRKDELAVVKKEPYLEYTEDQKANLKERLAGADKNLKAAQKIEKDAQNALAKAKEKVTKAKDAAEENRKKLEAARSVKKAPKKPVIGKKDIVEAAKKEGTTAGVVALNASDIKQVIKDLVKQQAHPKVAAIGEALKSCFDGISTTKELIEALAIVTGKKPAPKPTKK